MAPFDVYSDYFTPFWVYFSVISGMLFIGLAHIIAKLHVATQQERLTSSSEATSVSLPSISASLSNEVTEKIEYTSGEEEAAASTELMELTKAVQGDLEDQQAETIAMEKSVVPPMELPKEDTLKELISEVTKNNSQPTEEEHVGVDDKDETDDTINAANLDSYEFVSVIRSRKDRQKTEKKKGLFSGKSKKKDKPAKPVKETAVREEKASKKVATVPVSGHIEVNNAEEVRFDIFLQISRYYRDKFNKKPLTIKATSLKDHYYIFTNRKKKILVEINGNEVIEK